MTFLDSLEKKVKIMTNDENILPSVAPTVYSLFKQFQEKGLKEEDIVYLIQKRNRNLKIVQIRGTIEALKKLEKQILEENWHHKTD